MNRCLLDGRRDRDARLRRRENGGEIAMGDGSLAVAEPVGRGEALERAGERAHGLARTSVGEQLSQFEAEPILICGALRDISAAEQAENRLREVAEE